MRFLLWLVLLGLVGCADAPFPSVPQKPPGPVSASASPRPTVSSTPARTRPDWAILDEEQAPPLPERPPFRFAGLESDTYPKSPPAVKLRTGKSDASSREMQRVSRIAWQGIRGDYRQLDAKVAALADNRQYTVATLAAALSQLATTPELKLRAIYRWESAHIHYDDGVLKGDQVTHSQWPTDVLRDRVAVCDGFARLYCALAQEMGLECETVVGYAKGALVLHADWGRPNHRWVRVKLEDGWALVDPTWSQAWQGNDRWAYQDQYFLMPPQQMLLDHWPVQPQWQLMTPALSFDAFTGGRREHRP